MKTSFRLLPLTRNGSCPNASAAKGSTKIRKRERGGSGNRKARAIGSREVTPSQTLTIRERYMYAWRLTEQGEYDKAIDEINESLSVDANSTLPMHMKAYIYEQSGQMEEALAAWSLPAEQALNHHAKTKVVELSRKLGKEVEAHPSDILKQEARRKRQLAAPRPTGP